LLDIILLDNVLSIVNPRNLECKTLGINFIINRWAIPSLRVNVMSFSKFNER